jgi:chromosome segregation ATPase
MDDKFRITKDVSARKNSVATPTMQSDLKAAAAAAAAVAAEEASRKAFTDTLIAGYEGQIEAMQKQHEVEMDELKTEQKNLKASFGEMEAECRVELGEMKENYNTGLEDHSKAHQQSLNKALEGAKKEMSDLVGEKKKVEANLQKAMLHINKMQADKKGEVEEYQNQIEHTEDHLAALKKQLGDSKQGYVELTREIDDLKQRLAARPGNWVELVFPKKGPRRARSLVLRPQATWLEAMYRLRKDMQKPKTAVITCEYKGRKVKDESMTLEQVC